MTAMYRLVQLLVVACFTLVSIASPTTTVDLPRQTNEAENECRADGFSPKPTTVPFHFDLLKRQNGFSTVCGYISGISTRRLTCGTGYCGKKSIYNAIGCCTTSTVSSGETLLSGCTFRTQCWDSTAISSRCTGSCVTDSMVLKCSNSANPYCFRYTFTDIGSVILGCSTERLTINVASTPVDTTPSTGGTTTRVTVAGSGAAPSTVTVVESPAPTGNLDLVTITSTAGNGQATVITTRVSGGYAGLDSIGPTDTTHGSNTATTEKADHSTGTASPVPVPVQKSSSNVGAIAGGTVGGIAALALLGGLIGFFVYKKRKNNKASTAPPSSHPVMAYMDPGAAMGGQRPMSMAPTMMTQSPPPTVPSMYGAPPPGGYYEQQKPGFVSPTVTETGYTQGPPVYDMNQQRGMQGGYHEGPGMQPQQVYELGTPVGAMQQQQQAPTQSPTHSPVQPQAQPAMQHSPVQPQAQPVMQQPEMPQAPQAQQPPQAPPVQQVPEQQQPQHGGWGSAWNVYGQQQR